MKGGGSGLSPHVRNLLRFVPLASPPEGFFAGSKLIDYLAAFDDVKRGRAKDTRKEDVDR